VAALFNFSTGAPLKELTISKQAIFLIILVAGAGIILIRRIPTNLVEQTSTHPRMK
jgi:hypothetical protein